jgi:beta-galactosidase
MYAKNPGQVIRDFVNPAFDHSGWDSIRVPAHIQLQGYDKPQYVNTQYPWDGHEEISPGQVPTTFNPVGCYVKTFRLDQPLAPGERLSVSFKGAESAIAVWLNGKYIGYGTDSFTPSEFDLTPALVVGDNMLAAQVFKWSASSWLEDQDFFRFSGLFRDVELYRRPATHAEDIRVSTTVAADLKGARITLKVALTGRGKAKVSLRGVVDFEETQPGVFELDVRDPHLWSAEDPYLYQVAIEVFGEDGALAEYIPQRVGIRRCGIEGGLLRINGKRIVFKGVNRHEFGLHGRVMTRAEVEADIRALKCFGINAVRTSHYPNNSYFYELCDEYGVYVIDEMNMESHGLWDLIRYGSFPIDEATPGDRPEWLPMLLARAANMLQRDKNHACIVMWSCGNESFGGKDIFEVSNYFRGNDDRPVHYEGVTWDPRYPETTDVVSQMYTPAAKIEEFLRTHREKPFILCEYAHSMGNSFGAVDKYVDLAYRDELFQGGFIWDFADQALLMQDRFGRAFFGYGGDSGEAPHDGDFSGNGIFFADHSPTPRMQEVHYLYQGLVTAITETEITVTNRYLFTPSSNYRCTVTLSREGTQLSQYDLETDVQPGESVAYSNPVVLPVEQGEYTIDVSFSLREEARWAPAGHEIAWEQQVFEVLPDGVEPGARQCAQVTESPEVIQGNHTVGVKGPHFHAIFSRLVGGLQSYQYGTTPRGGRELLRAVPMPNFWHAPTSNERGWGGPARDAGWLAASRYATARKGPMELDFLMRGTCAVVTYTYALPTAPESTCTVEYAVDGAGRVEVTATLRPGEGLPDAPEFGMLFVAGAELSHLRFYGEGPEECYVDRRNGARLGIYEGAVANQLTAYLRPQEAGSHTGVRWAEVTDDDGAGLRFDAAGAPQGMEFSAMPWTPYEVENARHPNELPPVLHTVIRPAFMRRGVGGDDSWGAMTHPEYRLPVDQELRFTFGFQGIL